MSNPRSASNAWAKIKTKLMVNPDGTPVPTPKKAAGGKKKAAAKDEGEEGEAATPKKTPRKRVAKKQEVDGDASPKKKGRATKKASDDEGEYSSSNGRVNLQDTFPYPAGLWLFPSMSSSLTARSQGQGRVRWL